MSAKPCAKCNFLQCQCGTWCANTDRCCDPRQFYNIFPAGPRIYTGEDNIGNRPCVSNLKKCTDGIRNWCSNDGKCPCVPKSKCPLPPFHNYNDRLIKEGYEGEENDEPWIGVL